MQQKSRTPQNPNDGVLSVSQERSIQEMQNRRSDILQPADKFLGF